ncbi:MAG: PAQR family membrane homeostasis protein TrhA [Lachnospiraceae bacterium]
MKKNITIPNYSLSEELINAVSHGIGAVLSVVALVLCVISASRHHSAKAIIACSLYGSMSIILYTVSTLYHALKAGKAKRILRILDHCSIYLLIVGTYTPYCLIALPAPLGLIIWCINLSCGILGVILNAINMYKYRVVSMILYIIMGWMIIFSFKSLVSSIEKGGVVLMLIAGGLYTIGALFYIIGKKIKYIHSVFHFFVLGASIFFFFSIYLYVI